MPVMVRVERSQILYECFSSLPFVLYIFYFIFSEAELKQSA